MSCEGPPLLNLSGLGTAKVCIGSFGRANGISSTPAQGRRVIFPSPVIIPPPPPPLARVIRNSRSSKYWVLEGEVVQLSTDGD